jgi:hypothetical protein
MSTAKPAAHAVNTCRRSAGQSTVRGRNAAARLPGEEEMMLSAGGRLVH